MDGCIFRVVLKHCRTVDGGLYVQSCFKERQDCRWIVVCSKMFESTGGQYMVDCMFKVVLEHCRTVNG